MKKVNCWWEIEFFCTVPKITLSSKIGTALLKNVLKHMLWHVSIYQSHFGPREIVVRSQKIPPVVGWSVV